MKASELSTRAIDIATKYKTLYVMGCFGAPMNQVNKTRYTNNNAYNRRTDRTEKILKADADVYGFDCNCLFKSILWDWSGDPSQIYGGATYQSNGVPDATIKFIASNCRDVSSDFTNVRAGEYLWNADYSHAGICVGLVDGKLCKVECTPGWADGVQLFEMNKGNTFAFHGKSLYVEYEEPEPLPGNEITFEVIPVHLGCVGEYVRPVQIILKGEGLYQDAIDCSAGRNTDKAIRSYQQKYALDVDGYFGPQCWRNFLGKEK